MRFIAVYGYLTLPPFLQNTWIVDTKWKKKSIVHKDINQIDDNKQRLLMKIVLIFRWWHIRHFAVICEENACLPECLQTVNDRCHSKFIQNYVFKLARTNKCSKLDGICVWTNAIQSMYTMHLHWSVFRVERQEGREQTYNSSNEQHNPSSFQFWNETCFSVHRFLRIQHYV